MIHAIWNTLDEYFSKHPQDVASNATTKEKIRQAEELLGVSFHEPYRTFLRRYGGACIGSKLVYGLEIQEDMCEEMSTVINVTNFYREQEWPDIQNWYIVSDDFDGNPIGIDPEGKVWLSDHDAGFEKVKLANNFEEFLHKLLTDSLYQ